MSYWLHCLRNGTLKPSAFASIGAAAASRRASSVLVRPCWWIGGSRYIDLQWLKTLQLLPRKVKEPTTSVSKEEGPALGQDKRGYKLPTVSAVFIVSLWYWSIHETLTIFKFVHHLHLCCGVLAILCGRGRNKCARAEFAPGLLVWEGSRQLVWRACVRDALAQAACPFVLSGSYLQIVANIFEYHTMYN